MSEFTDSDMMLALDSFLQPRLSIVLIGHGRITTKTIDANIKFLHNSLFSENIDEAAFNKYMTSFRYISACRSGNVSTSTVDSTLPDLMKEIGNVKDTDPDFIFDPTLNMLASAKAKAMPASVKRIKCKNMNESVAIARMKDDIERTGSDGLFRDYNIDLGMDKIYEFDTECEQNIWVISKDRPTSIQDYIFIGLSDQAAIILTNINNIIYKRTKSTKLPLSLLLLFAFKSGIGFSMIDYSCSGVKLESHAYSRAKHINRDATRSTDEKRRHRILERHHNRITQSVNPLIHNIIKKSKSKREAAFNSLRAKGRIQRKRKTKKRR